MSREYTGNCYLEDFEIWPSHLERLSVLTMFAPADYDHRGLQLWSHVCGVGLANALLIPRQKTKPRQWGFGRAS
jgi:hypothetical protein